MNQNNIKFKWLFNYYVALGNLQSWMSFFVVSTYFILSLKIESQQCVAFGLEQITSKWLDAFLAKSLNCWFCPCHISYDWYGHSLTMWRFHWISLYRFLSFTIEWSEWFSYQISKSCLWLLWFAICLLIFGV